MHIVISVFNALFFIKIVIFIFTTYFKQIIYSIFKFYKLYK